ncbi:chemotaxis protein CheX [Bacillus canaveralius]|uniref:Chemotaxis protein CheX n=1 Tax=Bacillus canaveralius TaxID=1403243 RepID=A0A2N5GN18_9BACI|nr:MULTISPECIES: chemotaxis protein CheX [Bacillus]PLR81374.1 chemotaxis protein CheX [Bacillus sp. V33-4]PLR83538.1 chemotaxis protein CheX [Bacillus canaveralius]PLS00724.1 chemotaxis protein CheX [Bacillus canaveralius]RSK48613.1 chemotaxis protein CheX [Bacillus canaveralius]
MNLTQSQPVSILMDGMLSSLDHVVPVPYEKGSPQSLENYLNLQFGVLIGLTGDLKGKIIYKGDQELFGSLGEAMYGMPMEGEMLKSFAGELGNMISGGLCANVFQQGISLDITSPTIMEGDSKISGFKKGIQFVVTFKEKGNLIIYFLLD